MTLRRALKLMAPEGVSGGLGTVFAASLLASDGEEESFAGWAAGSSSRLSPALSMSSRRTMQRSGRSSKSEERSDSVRSLSLRDTQ